MGIGFAESMDSGRRGMAKERARAAKEKAGEGELGRDGASAPVPSSLSAWAAGARLVDGFSAMVVCFFSVHVIETHVYFIFFQRYFSPHRTLGLGPFLISLYTPTSLPSTSLHAPSRASRLRIIPLPAALGVPTRWPPTPPSCSALSTPSLTTRPYLTCHADRSTISLTNGAKRTSGAPGAT